MSVLAKSADANGVKAHTNGTVPLTNGSTQSYAARHKLADHFIGGNKLENAAPGLVKDFVAACDGHTVITNVRLNKTPRMGDGRRNANFGM
jgi:acetyl-CoA carboxylase/biotin carboxylase 1